VSAAAPELLTLISADQARRLMSQTPPVSTETVDLGAAHGRVLASPLIADEDLPSFRRSTMDGYAVRARDVAGASDGAPVPLVLVGTVPMGGVFSGALTEGQAVGISTGGFVPDGADAVVMLEYVTSASGRGSGNDGGGGRIAIAKRAAPGDNIIEPGEDIRRGATVLPAGRRLRPQDVAALASFGTARVSVFRRPRIAVLSTGNELCEPTARPAAGQVRDVNQSVLAAQVEAAGCEVTHGGIVRDDADALSAAVSLLLPAHDGLILSGGSSVGVRDVSGEVLRALGPPGVLFHGIRIRPGKPTIFARVGDKPVVGMPGFPTSSMIVFDAFIRPMLWRLGGETGRASWPARRRARLSRRHPSAPGREDYVRVRLRTDADGEAWADPLLGGSAAISNVIDADGLVIMGAEMESVAEGEQVEVCLYA